MIGDGANHAKKVGVVASHVGFVGKDVRDKFTVSIFRGILIQVHSLMLFLRHSLKSNLKSLMNKWLINRSKMKLRKNGC